MFLILYINPIQCLFNIIINICNFYGTNYGGDTLPNQNMPI